MPPDDPTDPEHRAALRHFLASIAYRTQKALREAPNGFGDFRAAPGIRTPKELVRHMTGVLGYARTFFEGGTWRPAALDDLGAEVARFHEILESLGDHLERGSPFRDTTSMRMLQGPFSDAMTHAGQLALLRRLHGSPVPPENFILADVDPRNFGPDQPDPVSPDEEWTLPDGE
ncbi:MAG: amino acid kinase family protein [Planctomycetota bacterium]|jgi:hypothetical protein